MGRAYAFKLAFKAQSPLLIGSGSQMGNIKEAFKIGKYYVIPSSSWKGVMRREALSVALSLELDKDVKELLEEHLKGNEKSGENVSFHSPSGCSRLPELKSKNGIVDLEAMKQSIEPELFHLLHESIKVEEAQSEICAALKSFACPLDSIFGSIYFTSLANFSSSVFIGNPEFRAHASIDRKTMAVSEGHLFTEESVWPAGTIKLYVTLVIPERRELYGYVRDPELIKSLWRATLNKISKYGTFVGSGKSRGLGLLMLNSQESQYAEFPEIADSYSWRSLDSFLTG